MIWLVLGLGLGMMTMTTQGQENPKEPREWLARMVKLREAGNYREAADVGVKALEPEVDMKPSLRSEILGELVRSLQRLNAWQEAEDEVRKVAETYEDDWRVLTEAASRLMEMPKHGQVVDGEFRRADNRGRGLWKSVQERDRVQALRWLEVARLNLDNDLLVDERAQLWTMLKQALEMNRGSAWGLFVKTDLANEPGFDDEEGYDEPGSGYPVDDGGEPRYLGVPENYEAAANDGERIRFALAQMEGLDEHWTAKAKKMWADMVARWFGVRRHGWGGPWESEGTDAAGVTALHTLAEDETVVQLATGLKRVKLPPDYAFLKLRRALAEDESVGDADRSHQWSLMANEFTNRWQMVQAAEVLKQAIDLADHDRRKKQLTEQRNQIVGNWVWLEPMETQVPGNPAKLSLGFRNATGVEFSARKVNVAKLIEDTIAFIRTKPQESDYWQTQLDTVGRRLLEEGGNTYLGKIEHEWSVDLEPADNHWDRRTEIETPIETAGAWWIEAKVVEGNVARAVVWIDDLVIVKKPHEKGHWFYVADAVTGAPVAGAKLSGFGYERSWKRQSLVADKQLLEYKFKEFSDKTREDRVLLVSDQRLDSEYEWVLQGADDSGRMAFFGFSRFWSHGGGGSRFGGSDNDELYLITDRPVYRPDQTMKWKAWLRVASYDPDERLNPMAGKTILVTVLDPRGEKLSESKVKVDEWGGASGELHLPEETALGTYEINLTVNKVLGEDEFLGEQSFRVEEYKKPEFEVKIEAPTEPVLLGDSFEVKVKADYYFGGPVKEGKVKYRVERLDPYVRWWPVGRWDWLFGAGYGWRNSIYDWYPGSGSWCKCIFTEPIYNYGPGELVAEGESEIGADGIVSVKIDTMLAKELHGDQDHRYSITAEVTDESRRTIFGSGEVIAARRPFEVYVWLNGGYFLTGEGAVISASARTLNGKPVKTTGTLKVYRVTYAKNGDPKEEGVAEFEVASDEDGQVKQSLKWAKPGQYRVSAKLKDAAGHEIEGVSFVTVLGEEQESTEGLRFDDLELTVRRDEYAPGDEAELLIQTNAEGSTVALFLRPENGAYGDPIWLKLDGQSAVHRFKLTEADQPNLFAEVMTVRNGRLHQVAKQIVVPPVKRIAKVELIPDKESYLPQEKPSVKVRVLDQNGEPFQGQLVLTGYDKALEYISGGSQVGDIREFFWGWKRSHEPSAVDTFRALETALMRDGETWPSVFGTADIYLGVGASAADPFGGGDARAAGGVSYALEMPASAPAPGAPMAKASRAGLMAADSFSAVAESGPVGGMPEDPQPMIRKDLADSAVWIAAVETDASGMATLEFDLPDNLTTWKLRGWVMGRETQVGEASVEVITRKDLMLRLQAPRFFVEKDEVVLSANVHNELDVVQTVRAVLELEGGTLEVMAGEEMQSDVIPAHGEKRFDWRVRVVKEGEAVVRMKALAEKDADAMEMTFPVFVHGTLKTDSWSISMRPDETKAAFTIRVPEDRKPEQSRLEITYTPSLAVTMVDALPFLVDYPYGCTEQTLNRFVPTVIARRALREMKVDLDVVAERLEQAERENPLLKNHAQRLLGSRRAVFSEVEVRKMSRVGVNRLEAMRGADGGWGWFPGTRESSAHITAQVVHGLRLAKVSGLEVTDGLIEGGVAWLSGHETARVARLEAAEDDRDRLKFPDNLDALVHAVLVENGVGSDEMRRRLYESRTRLSRVNLALLGLACHAKGEMERRDMLLRNLRQFLKQDDENQTAWLELPGGGGYWWFWYDDEIETQAAFLKLLVAAEPKGDLAPRLVKYLVNNRRNGTYWKSTRDTAAVIEALADYMRATGEADPNLEIAIRMNGEEVHRATVTTENLLTERHAFVMEGESVTTGEHRIEIAKQGKTPLYAGAYLTVFSKEDPIPAAGLEVKVRRTFYKLIEEKHDTKVAGSRGQAVGQMGVRYRREAIASDAEIQSGDLIEVELTVESKNDYEYLVIDDPKPAGFETVEVQSGWTWEKLPAYKEFRDERVAFFVETLPQGTHNLSYRVKAEIPGRFSALPTKVEAMYAPTIRGNAAEWKARIGE